MRTGRQSPVDMFHNTTVLFAGGVEWVHVDDGLGEVQHVMQQVMPHLVVTSVRA